MSCTKLCGFFSQWKKIFKKIQLHDLIKHIINATWKSKFEFFVFGCMCVLNEIFLKDHNGHKNEELQKSYLRTICLYYQYKNCVKPMISLNKAWVTMNT